MKKIVINIFVIVYFLFAVIITVSLLSYNNFNVAVFKDYSLITKKNGRELNCATDELVIIKSNKNIKIGDAVFYYDTYDSSVDVKEGKVKNIEIINKNEKTITLEDNKVISSEYVIGNESKSYAFLGTLYNLFTSRLGYLFIIILPMLMAFIYEIYEIIREIKRG